MMSSSKSNGKIFIVKVKWDEDVTDAKVKRVFFFEENAIAYINKVKKEEKYKNAFWIMSDRTMSDYAPCMTPDELEKFKLRSKQEFIEQMQSDKFNPNRTTKWDSNKFLEDSWATMEERIIEIDG